MEKIEELLTPSMEGNLQLKVTVGRSEKILGGVSSSREDVHCGSVLLESPDRMVIRQQM